LHRLDFIVDLSCLRQYTRTGPRGRSNAEERSLYGSSADASQNRFAMKANIMILQKNGKNAGCCDMLFANLFYSFAFCTRRPGTGCVYYDLAEVFSVPGVQGCMFIIALYVFHMFLPVARGTGCCNCFKYSSYI
jgi:hypothetical protein